MLWTEKYRPQRFEDIAGQDEVVRHLSSFAKTRIVPHLLLSGRHGTGKTCAIECFARCLYGENWQTNTSIFQSADLFLTGKSYLEQDERYAHLYRKQESLLSNFKYIIRSYAAMRPLDAPFKLMVFEDAHALTREAQQALRRIMESTSITCRFILTTTNLSAIIPAISSRCLPLYFSPIDNTILLSCLQKIGGKEIDGDGIHSCNDEQLELIVQASEGDLRRAILLFQIAMKSGPSQDLMAISYSETATVTASALAALRNGDLRTASRELESLMIDYGLSGSDVISEIRPVLQREFNHPLAALALADADIRIRHGNSEFIQIGSLITGLKEVFP